MEGSRCVRSNGREWRCSQQALVGHARCAHHCMQLRLNNIKRVSKRKKNDAEKLMEDLWCVCAKRGWRCSRRALVGQTMCEHHNGQLKQKNTKSARHRPQKLQDTPSFFDDAFAKVNVKRKGSDAAKLVEDKLCVCAKRGWKCSRLALFGHTICEHHYGQLTLENNISARSRQQKHDDTTLDADGAFVKRKESDGEKRVDGLQCVRSNGRRWRCRRQALLGHTMCEHHLRLKGIIRAKERNEKNVDTSSYHKDMDEKDILFVMKREGMDAKEERSKCSEMKWDDVHVVYSSDVCDQKHSVKNKGSEAEKQVNSYSMYDDHFGKRRNTSVHNNPVDISRYNDVEEKDQANTKGTSGAERVREDSQCIRSNGKRWRCRKQALMGCRLCEHHLVQARNYKAQLIPVKRKGVNVREKISRTIDKKSVDRCDDFDGMFHMGSAKRRNISVHNNPVDISRYNDVEEKDQANTKGTRGAERVREDSQCIRSNGKRWRCRKQALMGCRLCEHHLVQARNYKAQLIPVKRRGVNVREKISRTIDKKSVDRCDDFDGMFHMGSAKRRGSEGARITEDSRCRSADGRVKEKKEGNQTAKTMEDSRCTHTNGERCRCRQHALVGHKMCRHHLVQIRNYKHRNADTSSDNKDEDGNAQLLADSRCRCMDGRGWRCSQQALAGYNFCNHHFGKRRLC